MENNAYTIWKGEYSDADVIGVAFDEQIAKAYAKIHDGYVETAPLITDRNFITRANNMIEEHVIIYSVQKDYSKWERKAIYTSQIEPKDKEEHEYIILNNYDKCYYIKFFIYGRHTLNELEKIGFDKIMKYMAEQRGL